MSDVFGIFNNGHEHLARQRDYERVRIFLREEGAPGPEPLDLESGTVSIVPPAEEPGDPT